MRTISWMLIFIVLAGGGYLIFQNSQEDVALDKEQKDKIEVIPEGFVNYTNNEYGFALLQPSNWDAQEALKPQESRALHDIVFGAKEYDMVRPSFTVRIFTNDEGKILDEWWGAWLADEDAKKEECVAEYADTAPCLFLRGLIEREENSTLAGQDALEVAFFRFDSEEECVFTAKGDYVYGLCYDGANPNDPNFEANSKTTNTMRETFAFTRVAEGKNIEESMLGEWQSADDVKSFKVFKEEGMTEERYDGEIMSSGTWEIINTAQINGSDVAGTFLRVMSGGDEFLYTVVSIEETEMELTYLPRGNTLKYLRQAN